MAQKWHKGAHWVNARRRTLERDAHICQIRNLDVCTVKATHVDHIVSPRLGGAWWDLTNLRAACEACNLARPRPTLPDERKVKGPSRAW